MTAYAGTSYGLRSLINLDLKSNHTFWIVIGKTDAWENNTVEAFVPGDTTISNPVIAIKPSVTSLVREVSEVDYNLVPEGQRVSVVIDNVTHYFVFVADEDYLTESARFLYCHAIYSTPLLQPSPSTGTFRQYSLFLDLVPAAGYEQAEWLDPEHIDDYGILAYSNKRDAIAVTEAGPVVILPVLVEIR